MAPLLVGGGVLTNAAVAHAAIASTVPGAIIAAVGAFVIGLGLDAVKSYKAMEMEARKSHYRYLTALQEAGIVILSEGEAKVLSAH